MISVAQQRVEVVREALSWDGCRYHPMGRVKIVRDAGGAILDPGGIDCGTLLVEVFQRAGVIGHVDLPRYSHDWHLHRTGERYLNLVTQFAHEIDEADVRPGDVVLCRYGKTFSHGAIIIEPGWPHVIHALYSARRVGCDRGDQGEWARLPRKFFSAWNA